MQNIIDVLSTKLNTVDEIKEDVQDIKQCLITNCISKRKNND